MDSALLQLIDCDPALKQVDATGAAPLDKIITAVETMLKDSVDANYQGERVLQLLRLERADNFYRGIQNIAPTMDGQTGAIGWTQFGPSAGKTGDPQTQARAFDYNPRLTKSYGDKFIAVLGQRPFYNSTAEPIDENKEQDRRGARQVNLLIQMLSGQLDLKTLNKQLCYILYKNGTAIGQAKPVVDAKRFGTHDIPNLIPHTTCLGCGNTAPNASPDTASPQTCQQPNPASVSGTCGGPLANTAAPDPTQPVLSIPQRSVDLELFSGYTHTWPFSVKFQTGALRYSPWVVAKSEKDRGAVLRDYPQARKIVGMGTNSQYGSGSPDDATAAVVRASAQSQTGTIRSRNLNVWTEALYDIDASQIELIDDDATRMLVKQYFSDGIFCVQIEGKTVAIHNQDYRKKLTVCTPAMSDYLFTDGGCWGMLGLEDFYSNMLNIIAETLETGIMRFIVNEEYVSGDDLNRNRYSPNRFVSAVPKYGDNLQNAVVPLPTSDYPQQITEVFGIIDGLIQNILGLLPQVYGQMPGNLTLGQARMMLNQGLMQLGTVAELISSFWEASWTNLVKMYCEIALTNPEFQGQSIDLDLIRSSGWMVKSDTAIPRSFAERVESLRALLQETPQLADTLKITTAANAGKLRQYMDLPDFEDPDEEAMDALNEIIDQLWQAAPMPPPPPQPGPPDPITGMPTPPPPPPPPQPSIAFNSMLFDPNMTMQLVRMSMLKAMLKPTAQRSQDSPGFQNLSAFFSQAQQAAAPPPPPPPQPKMTFTAKIPDLTPEQEGAVLNDFGVTVPPPHPGAIQARAQDKMNEQASSTPPNGTSPGGPGLPPPGPPNLSMPSGMMQPGTPAMPNPMGPIQ